jgi:RNA polymerase sigma factor (sigma-70 family)
MSVRNELGRPTLETGESATRQRQESQQHGDRLRVLSLHGLGLEDVSADLYGASVSGAGLGDEYDEADGPPLAGRWRQQTIRDLWSDVPDEVDTDEAAAVRDVIAALSEAQQDVYRLLYVEQLSEREAADELGVTHQAVHGRAARLRATIRDVLGVELDELSA